MSNKRFIVSDEVESDEYTEQELTEYLRDEHPGYTCTLGVNESMTVDHGISIVRVR